MPLLAGLRSSTYGIKPFPQPDWWVNSTASMASRFEGSQPSVIWIVAVMADESSIWLSATKKPGVEDPNILLTTPYVNEITLDKFDETGVKVWLQVEPGDADMATLIDLVLSQYGAHPCVIGFGVDVEWYRTSTNPEGRAVTDEEAQQWSEKVRAFNPNYQLFLKHWLPEKMPPTYRDGLFFVDDSQQFESFEEMASEFQEWAAVFAPAPVGFQFGYPADRPWWEQLEDPPSQIGQRLAADNPNLAGLYWVDFTAYEIWPDE